MPGEQIQPPTAEHMAYQKRMIRELGRAVMSVEYRWMTDIAEAIDQDSTVYTVRGVGATGRMEQDAFDRIMGALVPLVAEERTKRPVLILYDGDTDNPEAIDIGHIVGALADEFRGKRKRSQHKVSFKAAQMRTWYGPLVPEANLASHNLSPIKTYVFEPGLHPGEHSWFTQSDQLAAYPRYHQLYIGASGAIAAEQMFTYLAKVPPGHNPNITLFRAQVDRAYSKEIGEKLRAAKTEADRQKLERMEAQRTTNPFGMLHTSLGIFKEELLTDITRPDEDTYRLMAVWDNPDEVHIRGPHTELPANRSKFGRSGRRLRACKLLYENPAGRGAPSSRRKKRTSNSTLGRNKRCR